MSPSRSFQVRAAYRGADTEAQKEETLIKPSCRRWRFGSAKDPLQNPSFDVLMNQTYIKRDCDDCTVINIRVARRN